MVKLGAVHAIFGEYENALAVLQQAKMCDPSGA